MKAHHARALLHSAISELDQLRGTSFCRVGAFSGRSSLDREGGFAFGVCVWLLLHSGDGAIFLWGGRVRLGMESHFFVEAKSFSFWVEKR